MEDKTINEDAFKADSQSFGITSEPNVTFSVEDKDGNEIAKYDAVRPEKKVCKVTLEKSGAPYKVSFKQNEVDASQADKDDVEGAVLI